MTKKVVTMRRKALRGARLYDILFFGVIFIVLAVGALAFWGVREIRQDAAVVAVENSAKGMAGAVTVLVNAITTSNQEMEEKTLTSLEPDRLRDILANRLKNNSNLLSIMLSDANGLRYMLTRKPDGMLEGVPSSDVPDKLQWVFIDGDGEVHDKGLDSTFDRRAADKALTDEFHHLQPGQINWRSAYRFHELGESRITASTLIDKGGEQYMLSYVLPVNALLNHLEGADPGGAEKVFLYWDSGKVLPVGGEVASLNGQDPSRAQSAGQVVDPVVAETLERLDDLREKLGDPFPFKVGEEVWWAYVHPLSIFGDTMALGVAVPKRNIDSSLTSDTFLQVAGGVLVLCAFVALYFIHRNRARIIAMGSRQKAPVNELEVLQLIAVGEGRELEFKQTLRFNLKSGKNGKEIEHACMKSVAGFMNSGGGTLLVGVNDEGDITGFEEDNFKSEDKALLHFNNLVNQYIGTEFSRFLDTVIIEVNQKKILRAYCLPANTPAILKNGNSEEVYVRSGPASRQLSFSQFYEWLQER
ncbi:MAG: hypothetical protein CL942_13765 [Desulfovibrio sp.]|nr:hypothetical protein [Desulfovibrio sp.]